MQTLHFVGFTSDFKGLIFSVRQGAKSGGYIVPVTDDVQAALAEARRLGLGRDRVGAAGVEAVEHGPAERPAHAPRPESSLTPREIQTRLRAGCSVFEVAAEAAVDPGWVERFAPPVAAEQARVIDRARVLVVARTRGPASAAPLGDAVAANLVRRGVGLDHDEAAGAWQAHHLDASTWVVRFEHRWRGRSHVAEWQLDLLDGSLVPRNRLGSELGFVGGTRPPPRTSTASGAGKAGKAGKAGNARTSGRKATARA